MIREDRLRLEAMYGDDLPQELVDRYEAEAATLIQIGVRKVSVGTLARLVVDQRERDEAAASRVEPETMVVQGDPHPNDRVRVRFGGKECTGKFVRRLEKKVEVKIDDDEKPVRRLNPDQILGLIVNV